VTVISVSGVAVEFGADLLLSDVTFTVAARDRWGIVGRNGSGKTTLFRLVTRDLEPTRGSVARAPGLRISLLEQHRDFGSAHTVWEAAAGTFAELFTLEHSLAEQAAALGAAGDATTQGMLDRYAADLERFEREGGYTLAPRIDAVLHGLGFDPDQARVQPVATLSGGERGRLGLVCQLVAPADVLLLDEPTNHLDLETTEWLEGYLATLDATVLVISHDRDFLARIADHILHVEAGTAVPYAAGYAAFVEQRNERRLSQQRAYSRQRRAIDAEEDYIRRNIAGSNSAQAKGRRRRLSRVARLSAPPGEGGTMAIRFDAGERAGDQVLIAENLRVGAGDRVLLDRFSARVQRGEVVGLIGPNGAGKTTLLRALVGEQAPRSGTVRIPESVRVAHYRQDLAQVPQNDSLYDIIADRRPQWGRGPVQGHLGRFGFSGDSVLRSAGSLSGGERARMALALMMLEGANLLVFDEPTNHLDVESIEALEDAIEDFGGTVLLVSHDRALLRALVTQVWVLHDRRITEFPGTFAEWEEVSAERLHAARVAAAEEESIRRVRERKEVRGKSLPAGNAARAVHRRLEEAERSVADCEARVSAITSALADPDLYTRPGGAADAARLGSDLDAARRDLDAAFAAWERASAEAEAHG